MFLERNEELKKFQERVRGIYEREVRPLVDEYERKEAFPVPLFRILGAENLLCPRCPKEYGGPGLDKISECISIEVGTPRFVLNAASGLLRFYPAFLKASMLLNRFVQ